MPCHEGSKLMTPEFLKWVCFSIQVGYVQHNSDHPPPYIFTPKFFFGLGGNSQTTTLSSKRDRKDSQNRWETGSAYFKRAVNRQPGYRPGDS